MQRLTKKDAAPDFALENTFGELISLSDFRGRKIIVLALLRGFA